MRIRALGGLAALCALWACAPAAERLAREPTPPVPVERIGIVRLDFGEGRVLRAELAYTMDQRTKGLSNRPSLPADEGMLFLFRDRAQRQFWMKDTLIPLSIAFMVREGPEPSLLPPPTAGATPRPPPYLPGPVRLRILKVLDMEPCPKDQLICPLYPLNPKEVEPYDAALEVNKGWFASRGIGTGALATVSGLLPYPE